MLAIGLTGNFGSGKSTVARMLVELGARVLDADMVGHEALSPHTEVWREVVAAFGDGILHADGTVDRRRLGEVVFGDASSRDRLNRIMHPRMFEMVRERLEEWRKEGVMVAVLEATLLIEAGWMSLVEQVWVVVAPEERVAGRVDGGGAFAGAQVATRWRSQLPAAEKVKRADEVIDNSGTLDELRDKVRALWQ
ncbi:MAG: dephospho-CoA kinase, partial [Dehalococcoidia bacterium]|nr:dephospho-CoA kinase [Dehalococcoidia bacterium]